MNNKSMCNTNEEEYELRKGPWTLQEDNLLINYISSNGEGNWNLLSKLAGLKRTGKSCRLRWLNYLKPDIKRGNLTPQEQLLILELHSRWGNRWSKIAKHLPGRTDNEIKNYWRTRVQKQARQLKVDANSKAFLETVKCFWMPRLVEKIEQSSSTTLSTSSSSSISAVEIQDSSLFVSPLSPKPRNSMDSNNDHNDKSKGSNGCSSDYERVVKNLETDENPAYAAQACRNKNGYSDSIKDDCDHHHVDITSYSGEALGSQDLFLSEYLMPEAHWSFDEDQGVGIFWNTDELW